MYVSKLNITYYYYESKYKYVLRNAAVLYIVASPKEIIYLNIEIYRC